MIRLQLSDIKHFKDESYGEGLVGYVNKMLDIHPRGEVGSLGYLATDKIREMLKTLDITQEFDFGGKRTLKATFKEYDEATDIVRLDVSLATGTDAPSTGVLSIDLTGIPSAIDSLVNEIDGKYVQTVDDNGIYAVSTLQKDVNNLATTVVSAVGKEPLDSNDSNSSLLNILNEAYQAYIHGDEHSFVWPGLGIGSADELAQQRADWRKLLESDAFADKVRNAAFREIKNLTTNDYPTLASLLKNTSLVPKENGHEGEWFLKFEGDQLGFLDPLKFAASLLASVKDAAGLVDFAATFTIATAANKDDDENSQSGGSGDNTGGGSSSNNEGGGAGSTPTGGEGNVSSGGGSESGGDGAAVNVAASDSAKGSNATRGTGATSAASKQSVPRAGDGLPSVVPFAAVLALLLALALLPVAAARHRSR